MAVKNISALMLDMKASYDKSREKSKWRVLAGMNKEHHDIFIAGNNNLWQVKSEEVKPGEFVAVGMRVSRSDEELEKIMENGSPVPFGTVTPHKNISIIMAGVQRYSSESSSLLCREHLSGKQALLEQKLNEQVEKMMEDPAFSKKYKEHRDRLRMPYL